jgi:hypothetical protein
METHKERLTKILWDVARMELCTKRHKKDAQCIVLVTLGDIGAVAGKLLEDKDFQQLAKDMLNSPGDSVGSVP